MQEPHDCRYRYHDVGDCGGKLKVLAQNKHACCRAVAELAGRSPHPIPGILGACHELVTNHKKHAFYPLLRDNGRLFMRLLENPS